MTNSVTKYTRRVLATLSLISLLASLACLRIPRPAAPQVQGPGGSKTAADPSKIHPGQSTRADVLRDWGWCDAHAENDRLFIGSLKFSDEKGIEVSGPIVYKGGRRWSAMSLFVEFDENGVVTKSYMDRDRVRAISSWVIGHHDLPALDLSKPIEIRTRILKEGLHLHTWAENGVVVLGADNLEVRSEDKKGHGPVRFMLEQVLALQAVDVSTGEGLYYMQRITFQGAQGWPNLRLALSPADTVTLVRYLKQVRESALPK
jgi:hypothetical protein